MPERTLYEVMMLHPTATAPVINAVYRTLAKQYHPDHAGPDGAQRMARLNEAYAVLRDEQKRARYDEIIRSKGESPSAGAPPTNASRAATSPTMPGATNLKFEGGAWSVRPPSEPTPTPGQFGEAGAPPDYPRATGSIISFGRYRGWSVSQVAAYDRNYVEWLSRTMAGRSYHAELKQALSQASP